MNARRFESLEELHKGLAIMGHEYETFYNGKEYSFSNCSYNGKKRKFYASTDEVSFEYDTFDEMLDNFKEDGKSLREFILDMEVEIEF
jgi:hypothetical protein